MAETFQENRYRVGLNMAREQARRSPADEALESADDQLEAQEEQSQNFLRRRLAMLKNRAQDKEGGDSTEFLQKKAEEKLKKEIARKASWRAVNLAMGATLILIVLTVLVWTVQFIGGNILGSKVIPKLGIGETILWLIAMAIVFTFFHLIMFFIAMISYAYQNPLEALMQMSSFFKSILWEVFKNFFKS